ncbi:MAG: lamin tail domain-containing protein, partial [Deltaproteobacteria bacterium]|nr:lamin tail domain-containing protein [Deltaproteobacteria bacterium]
PGGTDPDNECPGEGMCDGSGSCEASTGCGNGSPDSGEDCDDNNTDSFDGCSAECLDPTSHLLISEVAAVPTAGEFIEIYNPTLASVDLSNVYLTDRNDYYLITQGPISGVGSDFVAKFPQGASIASQSFLVVSVQSATEYSNTYNSAVPDFDMDSGDLGAPAMEGTIGGSAGLTNSGEMVMLFQWDGSSDLVTDIDYLVWGNTTNATDKTGVTVGNGTYVADTAAASQGFAPAEENNGETMHRCDTAEDSETQSGGNGTSGHDETSEDCSLGWKRDAPPSPGSAPASGFCP